MLTRGVNYWISWADLTFMLFIAGLAAASVSEQHRAQAQTELAAAQKRIAELEHSNPCANADPFLEGFSKCVAGATRRPQIKRGGCFVTVGEDVIRFAKGEATPMNGDAAEAVASCLYTNALNFASSDRKSFDAITIHIDGHTDCVGDAKDNEGLGGERALSVYSRLLRLADAAPWPNKVAERDFLSRIAVRSFGETRPSPKSQCTEPEGWANDRRVVVSVQLATENAATEAGR